MPKDDTLPLHRQIGRYQILREIGRGTMGVVYEAFDPKLERTLALKTVLIRKDDPEQREFEERFQREGKSAARLNHANIVTIHDAGEEGEIAYIAMEYLEGRTLREVLDSGLRLNFDEIVNYATQMAEAVDYAHRFDIVHRDLKPANILISPAGRLKISDFGIAQLPSGNLTQAGTILGTPKYMSPEQVRGERLDGRSDIFSLGVILYEMLTGQQPFTGDSLAAIMYQILHGLPQDPGELAPEAPQGLRQVLARCLSKEKSDRYALAMEMARDLDDCRVLQPDPALMHRIFSGGQETLGSLPRSDQTDRTQALSPQQAPWNLHRVRPWVWLGSAGAVALIALAIALKPPTLSNPEPAPERAEATAATPIPEKPANSAAPSKNKPATKTRGFWRRQVDCFKHGICDKPKYQDPPQGF